MTSNGSQSVRIRTMMPDDRDFILQLTARLAAVGMPDWRDADKMQAFHEHYAEATVNASGPDQAVYIAEDERGARLGVIHVMESEDGLTGERQGYVATLAVTQDAAGQGIGRRLMERAETWCYDRDLRIIALEVFAQNMGARGFYSRLGYQDETLKMIKVLST